MIRYRSVVAVAALAVLLGADTAWAGPSAPSARVAARLAKRPPNNYLKHYLPDDRYILAGGIWRVVSTQTDRYYHKATCASMLRQRADLVIGFHSPAAAEEAGYMPDPFCNPQEMLELGTRGGGTGNIEIVNYSSKPLKITLSDGVSTVSMPPYWRYKKSRMIFVKKPTYLDLFFDTRGEGSATMSIDVHPGVNLGGVMTAAQKRQFWSSLGSGDMSMVRSSGNNSLANDIMNFMQRAAAAYKVRDVRVNGFVGTDETMLNNNTRVSHVRRIELHRGDKTVSFQTDNLTKKSDVKVFLTTLMPR